MLDVEFYSGKDLYSDGKIEDEILFKLHNGDNEDQILGDCKNWPVFYHFSPTRGDIINWYPFKEECKILEIGAGLGAITGELCKNAQSVKSVELSLKRSQIIERRHNKFDNLEIIVGNFCEIPSEKLGISQYDYITLIGVLEYTKSFFPKDEINPYKLLLDKISPLLDKDGMLIIAIENQMGLKYFSGYPEDHTGASFSGIENYSNIHHVETFGKKKLENLLEENNFTIEQFLYPYPDYKFPSDIFSNDCMPEKADQLGTPPLYDQDALEVFNYSKVLESVIDNSLFDQMSNSFLVFARKKQ